MMAGSKAMYLYIDKCCYDARTWGCTFFLEARFSELARLEGDLLSVTHIQGRKKRNQKKEKVE